MNKYAIVVAGGSGTRMKSATPKQFMLVNNMPVICHTINRFLQAYDDMRIIVVLPAPHFEEGRSMIESFFPGQSLIFATGGETRFQSVKHGLSKVIGDAVLFIHDAVRCAVPVDLIRRCYEACIQHGSAIPVVPVKDSVRQVTEQGNRPLDRNSIKLVQTPQVFLSRIILPAFDRDYNDSFTDEATVAEAAGHSVHLVDGDERNIKITTPADLDTVSGLIKID